MIKIQVVLLAVFVFQVCGVRAQEDMVLTSTIVEYEFSSTSDSVPVQRESNFHLESDTATHIHITAYWDEGTQSWVNKSKSIGVYDREANSLEMRNYYPNGNDWTGSVRYVFWYGNNDDISQYRLDIWDPSSGGDWLKSDSLSERWEQDSLVKIVEEYSWSEDSQMWELVDGSRNESTKDDEGILSSEVHSIWDSETIDWIPYTQTFFFYDDDGNISLKNTHIWVESGAYWYEYFRNKFFYDEALDMQIEERYQWDFWDSDWELTYRTGVSVFNSSGMSYLLAIKDDNFTRWAIYERVSSDTDDRGLVVKSTVESKSSDYGEWENESQTRNFYTDEEEPLRVEYSNWSQGSFVVESKKYFYYPEPEPPQVWIQDQEAEDVSYRIYPNPATSKVYIHGGDSIETVQVFDMHGKLIRSFEEREIDVSVFPAGLYFIRIFSKDGRTTILRFVKM